MQSCLYQGIVAHHRYEPVEHQLRYRVYMAYLDLEETSELLVQGILTRRRVSLGTFRSEDHVFGQNESIVNGLSRFLCSRGFRLNGPVRLLTQLRVLGLYFSPLNLYYCFDSQDRNVEAIVAEVSNTPWNERHHYLLCSKNQTAGRRLSYVHPKEFHVSPFMPMDTSYRWQISEPGEELHVGIDTRRAGRSLFSASTSMSRLDLTSANLRRLATRVPAAPIGLFAGIYVNALKLWWKKCPFYPHPNHAVDQPKPSLENKEQAISKSN